jgi:hypothetical protein
MAKASKKKKTLPKKERGSYNNKLSVKGSFMDIIKASVKDATNHSAKKKE